MTDFKHSVGQSYAPLRRLLSNDRIEELRKRIKVRYEHEEINWNEKTTHISDLKPSTWAPKLLIAIDGDYGISKIETGFPGSEVGYVTVSSVVILLNKIKKLEEQEFIDPKEFRQTEQLQSIESLFLGCNAVLKEEESAKGSMRKILYEDMQNHRAFDSGETLLDTYEAMLKIRLKRGVRDVPKCPHDNCDADLELGCGVYNCKVCGGVLYSTDALRLHELMNPVGSNGEMFGQIKEAFKKLQLIHVLRSLEHKEPTYLLFRDIAFFIEGSLTVFSSASWLAKSFREELERINTKAKEACDQDLLVIGIEKSGNFVNHFSDIDTKRDGAGDNFPKQSVFLPDNRYICDNIVLNNNPKFIYLKDTSFGRKFFYKTKSGYKIVPSIVTFGEYQSNVKTAYPAQFPRLADCMMLLDDLVSSRYSNSITPLASAHAEAAIPLNLGKRIFDNIAREIRDSQ